jgi:hypothetical protein
MQKIDTSIRQGLFENVRSGIVTELTHERDFACLVKLGSSYGLGTSFSSRNVHDWMLVGQEGEILALGGKSRDG